MITKSKLLILLVSLLSLSLAACSGTGRKDYASVQSEINATDTEKVYVYRTKQMMAKKRRQMMAKKKQHHIPAKQTTNLAI